MNLFVLIAMAKALVTTTLGLPPATSSRPSLSTSSGCSRFSGRRTLLLLLGTAALVPMTPVSSAEVVRLEKMENGKLRAALTAAVGGDFAKAEQILSEMLEEDQSSASVWSNRGNVRVSLGKYEQALDDFGRAISLAPEAPVPLLNRAIANEALGRYQEAVSDCQAAIRLDPEEYAAWYNLGNVDVRLKEYEPALVAYSNAAALAPGIAGYRLKQALVLFQLARVPESKRLIQGLVRKYPNYAEAHAALAAILWSQDRRSEAEDELNRATSQDPKFGDMSWIMSSLEWPSVASEAMDNLLLIKFVQSRENGGT